jgi:hypothetical protein
MYLSAKEWWQIMLFLFLEEGMDTHGTWIRIEVKHKPEHHINV